MKAKEFVKNICKENFTTEDAVQKIRDLQFEDFDRDIQPANYDFTKSKEVLENKIPELLDGNPAICTEKWHRSQLSVVRSQLKDKKTGEILGEDEVPISKRSFLNSGDKDGNNNNLHLPRDSSFGFNMAIYYLKNIIARMVEHCNSYSEKINEIDLRSLSDVEKEELNQKLEEKNNLAVDLIEANLSILEGHMKENIKGRLQILLNRL